MGIVAARPKPTALSAPFWAAAREGRLELQKCLDCDAFRWTPQVLCTACRSERYAWTPVSGRGKVYSHSTVYRSPTAEFHPPYVVAVVALDEGPLMLTNIVGCAPEAVRIDLPVAVAFERLDEEITLYLFRPCGDETGFSA
jgi:uncharacterized OB-fold protein